MAASISTQPLQGSRSASFDEARAPARRAGDAADKRLTDLTVVAYVVAHLIVFGACALAVFMSIVAVYAALAPYLS